MPKFKITHVEGTSVPNQLLITFGVDQTEVNKTPEERINSSFSVLYQPLKIYTVIVANNIHHAGNKASKLWKDNWTGITKGRPNYSNWKYVSIAEFGEIVTLG